MPLFPTKIHPLYVSSFSNFIYCPSLRGGNGICCQVILATIFSGATLQCPYIKIQTVLLKLLLKKAKLCLFTELDRKKLFLFL